MEKGNRENDGHGLSMMGRYMAYYKQGASKDWNRNHFAATLAGAEWINWQLETDLIRPGVRKDVLFTNSECAYDSYDIYSSFCCLWGLKLYIKMAEQLKETEYAEKWKKLYQRLAEGIYKELTDETEYGKVWHTEKNTEWQDHAHKLCHLDMATDGETFTPLEDYKNNETDSKFLQIDINSYRYLMKDKNYNSLRMYGYGQGFMAQSALLLDEMADYEKFLDMLLRHAYLPKFGRWISPEGIILHKSEKYYIPVNGYMGQDSHLADSVKAVRLMLGADDNKPEKMRLIPRFPLSYQYACVKKYPVQVQNKTIYMDYEYERGQTDCFSYHIPAEKLELEVRLGPQRGRTNKVFFNGKEHPFSQIESGDSTWIYIKNLTETDGKIEVFYL